MLGTIEMGTILVVLVLMSLSMLVVSVMNWRARLRISQEQMDDRTQLIARVTLTEQQLQLFWRIVNRKLAGLLHAPTHEVMDGLLRKVSEDTLAPDEAMTLHRMLQEHRQDLSIEGKTDTDLTMPTLLVLWSLEVKILEAGLDVPVPPVLGYYTGPTDQEGQSTEEPPKEGLP